MSAGTAVSAHGVEELADELCQRLERMTREVVALAEGRQRVFAAQREAERALLLRVLQIVRPALGWIADDEGDIIGFSGHGRYHGRYRFLVVDVRGAKGTWVAFDHPELGLAIALRTDRIRLVWPGHDLPSGREAGPRLTQALERLTDRLAAQLEGNAARRRREAQAALDRIRAIHVLLDPAK